MRPRVTARGPPGGGIIRAAAAPSRGETGGKVYGETLKVNERRDDTTKPESESRPAPRPGSYYYDDATGYETYAPEEGEAAGGEEPGGDDGGAG